MNEVTRNAEELENRLRECKAECERLEAEMQESRKQVRKDALTNLRNARNEYNAANSEHEKADDARDECRAALCGCVIGQREPDEVHAEVEADVKKSLELKKIAERKNSLLPAVILWLAAIVCAVAGAVYTKYAFGGTALFTVLGVLMLFLRRKRLRESAEADKKHCEILAKYKADDEEGIKLREKEFLKLHVAFTQSEELEHSTAAYLKQCRIKLEELENRTLEELDFCNGTGESAELTKLYNEKMQQYQQLAAEIEKLK